MKTALAGVVSLTVGVAANASIITFEELGTQTGGFAETTALRGQIAGAVFAGTTGLLDGGAVLNQLGGFGFNARSGEHFLAFNRNFFAMMADGGFPLDPEKITLSVPASEVAIYAATADDGSGMGVGRYRLQAFSMTDTLLGEDTIEARQDWTRLSVTSTQPIAYVVLTELSGSIAFAYDDFSFTPVPAPASAVLALLACSMASRRRR